MIYLKITEWDGFVMTPMPLIFIPVISNILYLIDFVNLSFWIAVNPSTIKRPLPKPSISIKLGSSITWLLNGIYILQINDNSGTWSKSNCNCLFTYLYNSLHMTTCTYIYSYHLIRVDITVDSCNSGFVGCPKTVHYYK